MTAHMNFSISSAWWTGVPEIFSVSVKRVTEDVTFTVLSCLPSSLSFLGGTGASHERARARGSDSAALRSSSMMCSARESPFNLCSRVDSLTGDGDGEVSALRGRYPCRRIASLGRLLPWEVCIRVKKRNVFGEMREAAAVSARRSDRCQLVSRYR